MAETQSGINGRSSDEIRRDIEHSRREMDSTLDDLGERLHPRNLLADAIDYFRSRDNRGAATDNAKGFGQDIARVVRNNPGPALMIAAGAAWAIYNASSDDRDRDARYDRYSDYGSARAGIPMSDRWGSHGYPPSVGGEDISSREWASSKAGELSDSARESASSAAEGIKDAGHRASESVQRYAGQARHQARRTYRDAGRRFGDAIEDSPMLVGLGFLAAGMLAGIALPRTRQEDRWMGEAADQVKDEAWRQGKDLIDRGRETAESVAHRAGEQAKEEGLHPDQLAEKAGRVMREASSSASDKARSEGIDTQSLKEKGSRIAHTAATEAREESERHRQEKADEARRRL